MHGDSELKEVRFDKWCSKCKFDKVNTEQLKATKTIIPCDACLEVPMRRGTEKPECWEKK